MPVPGIPETATDNEGRTAQARARHAGRPPAHAVAELEAAAEAADTEVAVRGEARLDEPIDWWGGRAATRIAVLVRAFETWTHADDIRRAIGAGMVAPPPASLLTMAHTACGLVPTMLAARGAYHPGRLVRFRFTDLGGAAWDVDLGAVGGVRPAGDDAVDAEIVTEAAAALPRHQRPARSPRADLRRRRRRAARPRRRRRPPGPGGALTAPAIGDDRRALAPASNMPTWRAGRPAPSGGDGSEDGEADPVGGVERDPRLMARVATGDETAFAALYDELAPTVYGIVLRVVRDPAQSEEVTQEVFVELWRQAARFDPARGGVRGWAGTIARRRAVDRVRSEQSLA